MFRRKDLEMALIINVIIAVITYKLKILNKMGTTFAFVIGCIVLCYRRDAYVILLSFLIIETFIEKAVTNKQEREVRTKEQIFCNSIIAILALIINCITGENEYYIVYVSAISCSLGDSMASTIGSKYAKKVYSLISLKEIEKGLSGGVSIIGTLFGVLGNFFIGLIYYLLLNHGTVEYINFLVIVISGFIGVMTDSILGDLFQKKYYCAKCGKEVDNIICCGSRTRKIKGILTNNEVNLISTAIVFVISWIILKI